MYIKVTNGIPSELRSKPDWYHNDGSKVTDDAIFIADGIYPVVDSPPEYDHHTQRRIKKPISEWTVNPTNVEVAYLIENMTAEEVADYAKSLIQFDVLSTDRWNIPADGLTFATLTFTSEEDVYFLVNNAVHKVTPVNYIATLEITADAPGAINVSVQDKQLIIIATEVT
jgi:hypothetical protein